MLAAGGAAVTAALVTTPLDVVKNRLQGQLEAGLGLPAAAAGADAAGLAAAGPPSAAGEAASSSSLRPASQAAYSRFKTVGGAAARVGRGGVPAGLQQYSFNTQTCPSTCPTVAAPGTVPRCGAGECQHTYRGPLDAIRKISRYDGVRAFWRGLDATLSLSVPTVGIYLPMYDWILGQLQARMELGAGAPVAAGMVARTIAVGVTNPLEIVRTRMQALPGSTSFRGELRSLLIDPRTQRVNRVGEIWRGTGITLLRDVPFSGLYWGLTEALKAELAEGLAWTEPGPAQVFTTNMAAGTAAGAAAALVTTPFDVIKTQRQIAADPQPLSAIATSLWRRGGAAALFTGWQPRIARVAPSCAIVLTSYELMKMLASSSPDGF